MRPKKTRTYGLSFALALLLMVFPKAPLKAQFFDGEAMFYGHNYPCLAYLYKYNEKVLRDVVVQVFGEQGLKTQNYNEEVYYRIPGVFFNPTLLGSVEILFRIDSISEEKTIVYVTAVDRDRDSYNVLIQQPLMRNRIILQHEDVEMVCVDYLRNVYAIDQKARVNRYKRDMEALLDEIKRIERYEPESTTVLNKLRTDLRVARQRYDQERAILENMEDKPSGNATKNEK